MVFNEKWLDVLSTIIVECVQYVNSNQPFEAEPRIMAEELVGYKIANQIFEDDNLLNVAIALELFCHAAQHDKQEVNGINLYKLGGILLECSEVIKKKELNFPAELSVFDD